MQYNISYYYINFCAYVVSSDSVYFACKVFYILVYFLLKMIYVMLVNAF